jgi:hypothetical protein
VPLTGEEIRRRLIELAERWSVYEGSERSEAQTFLNQLFECFGTKREDVARFEEPQNGGFIDLLWPRVCIVEMKRPSEADRLDFHRPQALNYWRRAANPERNVPAPRYLVICAFRRLEVWQPGEFPDAPRVELDLVELPDRYETLLFLAGREAVFTGGHEAITRQAVAKLTGLYQQLRERRAAEPEVLRDFALQSVWAMFAEDLGMLEAQLFTRLVDRLLADPQRSSHDDLGQLFTYLNTAGGGPDHGLYAGVRYANGGLFRRPAHVHLEPAELTLLREACESDWTRVQPSIFGSLLEGGLGHDMQWTLSAHYTHEADIEKIVGPTIADPWRERIGNIETLAEARAAQNELMRFVVLDPACGSGNFLYLAYRELRRVEHELRRREAELRQTSGAGEQSGLSLFFPLANIRGIEIEGFAVAVARVTLWMGHKLAVEELGLDEATLPLADLSGIVQGDALRIEWPRADVIVGNPPFHGDRNLRGLLGDEYVEWLRRAFRVGIKDYCVYWFRKAHDHLEEGKRAGLVGTNSIAQNRARGASLAYITENGGTITSAVASQDWPGEANVDVSIVNWVKSEEPVAPVRLDGVEIDEAIAASLRPVSLAVERAHRLDANEGHAFYGPIPGGSGFILEPDEAEQLLDRHGESWREVIRPYLVGNDILNQPDHGPSRYIIDFGFRTLEEAAQYEEALAIVRERVKPQRDRTRRQSYRENWWRFSEPIREMREALAGLERYIAGPAQGKRIQFVWVDAWTCPSNLTTVFAFDDYYSMGILSSGAHRAWALAQASTLEDRTRYTTTSTFDTFPWPDHGAGAARIAEQAEALIELRDRLCAEHGVGLTDLYNLVDDGGFRELASAQQALDRTVGEAYGWPPGAVGDDDETNRRLLALNLALSEDPERYHGPRARGSRG